MVDDDKQAIDVEQAPSPSVPSGQPAVQVTPIPASASQDQDEILTQCVSILANTQNECLAELGYHPTLLKDYQDLQTNNALLYNDNQKLYADNRSLAVFIKQQDQRLNLLQAPVDQQKNTITQLHELVRKLTQERDEFAGKLHQAYNEIVGLRQELARFVPTALPVGTRVVLTGQQQMHPAQGVVHHPQRRVSLPVLRPHPQQMPPGNAPMPQALMEYQSMPSPFAQQMYQPNMHQPHPQNHTSLPKLVPVTPSIPPPNIAHSRRASGPSSSALHHTGLKQSPLSPSPFHNFSGAGSPVTPVSSRPGTSSSASQLEHWANPSSRPSSSRGLHVPPPVPQNSSSSSLAGAIVDLTEDEGVAKKRRKYDHPPGVAMAQPPSLASPTVPISPATMVGRAPIVAQQYTVLPTAPHPQRPPASTSAPQPQHPQPPIAIPPQPTPLHAPQPHLATSHTTVMRQTPPMYVAQMSPTTAQVPQQPQQYYAYSQPPAQDYPVQPPAQAYPVQPQHSAMGPSMASALQPPQPITSSATTQQPPAPPPTAGPSAPPAIPIPPKVDSPPVQNHAPDVAMADVEMVSDEEETTVEEDCIEANFDEDDEDPKKLWCRMCRSRFNRGHTTEAPTPFVSAPQETLIAHCETVHPSGWAILKSKVAEQRAAENP